MEIPSSTQPIKKSTTPSESTDHSHDDHHTKKPLLPLTLAALGVVFGDIGTSPLYALRECFGGDNGVPNEAAIMGALSLILWTLLLVVSVKYVSIVMRANNRGEGGILALTALALKSENGKNHRKVAFISTLGILGAALLYSDGIITPAISVLSAVEGLTEISMQFKPYIIPIALVILIALFMVQSKGTGKVGALFGPVLVVWFIILGILGINGIIHNVSVLKAINPYWAIHYLFENRIALRGHGTFRA
jgi:KUP system potassium uptake protein